MIYRNSRYEYGIVDFFALDKEEDVQPVVFYPIPNINTINYFEYEWVEGDRLDTVAQKFYGNSSFWWTILDKNPAIVDPNNIEPGTKLIIESIE